MPKTKPPAAPPGNRLLARLPPEEYQRLLPRLQLVPLELKHVLYEARSPIDYAYFPNRGVVSALTVMEDGRAIEVATIGDEGMVGLPLLVGAKTTANRVIVQVPGEALRMAEDVLREEVEPGQPLAPVAGPLPHRLSCPGFAGGGLQRPALGSPALLPLAVDDPGPGALGRVPDDARVTGRDARRAAFHRLRGSRTLPRGRLDPLQPGEIHRPRPGGPEGRFLRVLPEDQRGIRALVRLNTKGRLMTDEGIPPGPFLSVG